MLAVAPVIVLGLTMAFGMKLVSADEALESPKRHVRAVDATVRSLLREGFERSATFASLMSQLEYSDVIVYVEQVPRLPDAIEGRMVMVRQAHDFRYVRIQIALRGDVRDTIALLGHELRHALEVADAPEVSDGATLAAMYKRIGIDRGHDVYDTQAAQDAGKRVLKELST